MAMWLIRAGNVGQFEKKFLDDSKVWLTWDSLSENLSRFHSREELLAHLGRLYENTDQPSNRQKNYSTQIWPFVSTIQTGDWFVLPSKLNPTLHFGEIVSDYCHHPAGPNPFFHYRTVRWLATDVPRSAFDQDLLYSMGAFMTICRLTRNDAERRIKAVASAGWKSVGLSTTHPTIDESDNVALDIESIARQEIAQIINQRFKGHELARLVGGILKAKGYTVLVTPPGADKGVDILAAPGSLGFGNPRICVQVKSGDGPSDTDTFMKLAGSMSHVGSEQGLLVSWGGFKSSIRGDLERSKFFSIRLWGQDELIGAMLEVYDKLDADLRTDLPLKQVWMVARGDDY